MNRLFSWKRCVACVLALLSMLVWQGCQGCNPPVLKTLDLSPSGMATGTSGIKGSIGWCLSPGNPPPTPFSPGAGQIMVGFDDFFRAGAPPFPCSDIRDAIFRGGVSFDLSQFSSIVSADLLYDAQNSISRSNGETTGQSPPQSFATTLGVGTQAFSFAMPDDNEASLPTSGPSFDVGVSSQVRDWISGAHPNFGFVIWGPRPPVDPGNPPEDNDAQITWYGNFKLRIVYNPAQNPNAPQ